MRCSFRGKRSILDVFIVILRGKCSTLDMSCCVFFAYRIVRPASSGDKVQIPWQAWSFVRCDENWRTPRTKPSILRYKIWPRFTLHTLHSTLYTPHSTLHTPHFTLYTPHSILYTPHFTLHTLHSRLYTPHSTLSHTTFFHIPQSTVHWCGNRGKMYKTLQMNCFTKVWLHTHVFRHLYH